MISCSSADGQRLEPKPETGLGLLRDPDLHVLRRPGGSTEMSPVAREFFTAPAPLIIAKANFLSPIRSRVHVDSIGIKLYSESGTLKGELAHRRPVLGLGL